MVGSVDVIVGVLGLIEVVITLVVTRACVAEAAPERNIRLGGIGVAIDDGDAAVLGQLRLHVVIFAVFVGVFEVVFDDEDAVGGSAEGLPAYVGVAIDLAIEAAHQHDGQRRVVVGNVHIIGISHAEHNLGIGIVDPLGVGDAVVLELEGQVDIFARLICASDGALSVVVVEGVPFVLVHTGGVDNIVAHLPGVGVLHVDLLVGTRHLEEPVAVGVAHRLVIHQMEGRLLLDVVIGQGAVVIQHRAGEDEDLVLGQEPFLVLDFGLHIQDVVRWLDIQRDGLLRQCLDEDLHGVGRQRKGHHQRQEQDVFCKCFHVFIVFVCFFLFQSELFLDVLMS